MEITILGIDLAKNVFQIHGADRMGKKLIGKKLSRKQLSDFVTHLPPCTIAMEACGGAHFWARKFRALGHEVKLIAPHFVKPFVKSNKNDRNDAEAIVEAALRPSMRFVPVKTVEQQDTLCLHRVRSRLVASRTALINEIRGLLAEYGVIVARGPEKLLNKFAEILEDDSNDISAKGRTLFERLRNELRELNEKVLNADREIKSLTSSNEVYSRLMKVPGVGPMTATAIVAAVGHAAAAFKSGRELSAWLGLVPKQNSSGGKTRLGSISKRGDVYLRNLLIHGARAVIYRLDHREDTQALWLKELIKRRGSNRACVALANKNARVLWAMMARGEEYRIAS